MVLNIKEGYNDVIYVKKKKVWVRVGGVRECACGRPLDVLSLSKLHQSS